MKVSDLMTKNVVSISPDESTSLAARLLYRHNIGSLPVCSSDGKLRGILTDRDIVLRCVAAENDPEHTPVREIMSRAPISTSPDDDVRQAAEMMAAHQIRRLPVTKRASWSACCRWATSPGRTPTTWRLRARCLKSL